MANNAIMRSKAVAATYAAVTASSIVGTFRIRCPSTNAAVVNFLADDGSDVPWAPGEWNDLHEVDLSLIQVKGQVGDKVIVVGGTWL